MTRCRDALAGIVDPALALLPARMDTPEARTLLLAIGLQESRLAHRRQIGGPARGLWQFELGGGVAGVLRHPASRHLARDVCRARGGPAEPQAVYEGLEHDDVLACCFARLLLWADPKPLPSVTDAEGGWVTYLRTWRPGKPHPDTWLALHREAANAVASRHHL